MRRREFNRNLLGLPLAACAALDGLGDSAISTLACCLPVDRLRMFRG